MKVLCGVLLASAMVGGCAVERRPMANIQPRYSYRQAGVTLPAPSEGQVQVTASHRRSALSPEMLSIGSATPLRTAGVVTD